MQTDIEPDGFWLTVPTPSLQCPLCSKPMKDRSSICYSCGFSWEPVEGSSVWIDPAVYPYHSSISRESEHVADIHRQTTEQEGQRHRLHRRQPNPITPIPPRASAQRPDGSSAYPLTKARQPKNTRLLAQDSRNMPAPSPAIWQYESPNFEVGSSLPTLSLMVSDIPTQPEPPTDKSNRSSKTTMRLPDIEEIDIVPSHLESLSDVSTRNTLPIDLRTPCTLEGRTLSSSVDKSDTFPSLEEFSPRQRSAVHGNNALVPVTHQPQVVTSDPASWTAGGASGSSYAQLIADRSKKTRQRSFIFNPFDGIRWWLLRPGRLEFILWLAGTILLISVTCVLLLATAFSFQWITPGLPGIPPASNSVSTAPGTHPVSTIVSSPGLDFTLLDNGPLLPGQPVHLHGKGFTPRGHVDFTYDGMHPLLDENGQPGSTQADAHGVFTVTLLLGVGPAWAPGRHLIVARDVATNHLAALSIIIAAPPIGTNTTATVVPTASSPQPTPTQGHSGGIPTPVPTLTPAPVGQTPVPSITPTVGITPTPTRTLPTPTPTAGVTPTPSPKPTSTLRPTPTAAVLTPTTSAFPDSGNSAMASTNLSDDLNNGGNTLITPSLSSMDPLVWVVILCYSLAMLMLGIAGVLHKRSKSVE